MTHRNQLENLRKRLMTKRQIICTGNPDKSFTIAQGIRKLYPTATFLCRSTGWDLADPGLDQKIKEQFSKHNTFINASFVNYGIQHRLLNLCYQSTKYCDVVNIGSTHEYDGGGSIDYQNSKLDLRNTSLALNSYRFKTCHLILGHLSTSDTANNRQIKIETVCNMIPWLFEQSYDIPIMSMVNQKEPW